MKAEMLIVAVAIILIGISIVKNVLPKEADFANEIVLPENEVVNEVDDQNIIENSVDVSVFEQ